MENNKIELQKLIDELIFDLKSYKAKANANSFYIEKQNQLINRLNKIMKTSFLKFHKHWSAVELEMDNLHKRDSSLVGYIIHFSMESGNNLGFIKIPKD